MSDARLRDLERRWKETGSVDDEAAYLLERVRVGDLTQERLELAAYCGHEGARRAAGELQQLGSDKPDREIGREIWRMGRRAAAHAALALMRRLDLSGEPRAGYERSTRAVEAWLETCDSAAAEHAIASADEYSPLSTALASVAGRQEGDALLDLCWIVHKAIEENGREDTLVTACRAMAAYLLEGPHFSDGRHPGGVE